jgi:zinc protease
MVILCQVCSAAGEGRHLRAGLGDGPTSQYAVVVSASVITDSAWAEVVDSLQAKHAGTVVTYDSTDVWSAQPDLALRQPAYICFVASPQHISSIGGEQYVRDIHQLARALDGDIYGDAIWGIVTGRDATDGLRIATGPSEISVGYALLKTAGGWLDYFRQGTYFSEATYNQMWYKEPDGPVITDVPGPTDCTDTLCTLLNSDQVDIMITSGHASQFDWQLHYPTADLEGFFKAQTTGQLYGEPHTGPDININSSNPKIYYAPGNCLIGEIPDFKWRQCMALAWMHTGGAYQYGGYTVLTWYGYSGWGVAGYLIKLKDRFSYAEACFLNNQSLLYDLENGTPGTDSTGLVHDRDVWAFYGDPACEARLENTTTVEPSYEQDLIVTGSGDQDTLTYRITMNRDGHPDKHPFVLFPCRVENPTVIYTDANDAVVTENFAMLNVWYSGQPNLTAGEEREVVFTTGALASAGEHQDIPPGVRLTQNYPNPFSRATTIRYELPEAARVEVTIFDVQGHVVRQLVRDFMPAGIHSVEWDGRDEEGCAVSTGVYFYSLVAGGKTLARKSILR